jgi:hypothetical protein
MVVQGKRLERPPVRAASESQTRTRISDFKLPLAQRAISAVMDGRIVSGIGRRIDESLLRWSLGLSLRRQTVAFSGNAIATPQTRALKSAFRSALEIGSHLPPEIRNIDGMSGQRYRAFANRLVSTIPEARYLEVGSWKGSTLCAALHGNAALGTCIEDWSHYGGPRDEFFANTNPVRSRLTIVENDFRKVDYRSLGQFNVYLFDGPHDEQDQYDGVVITQSALADRHVLIVDDWNWPPVRLGTLRALRDMGSRVLFAGEIRTIVSSGVSGTQTDWHNGVFAAAISRARA